GDGLLLHVGTQELPELAVVVDEEDRRHPALRRARGRRARAAPPRGSAHAAPEAVRRRLRARRSRPRPRAARRTLVSPRRTPRAAARPPRPRPPRGRRGRARTGARPPRSGAPRTPSGNLTARLSAPCRAKRLVATTGSDRIRRRERGPRADPVLRGGRG